MGWIYKLECPDGKFYIGSTTKAVRWRLTQHKQAWKTKVLPCYEAIENFDDVKVYVKAYPDISEDELRQLEIQHIRHAHANNPDLCLNVRDRKGIPLECDGDFEELTADTPEHSEHPARAIWESWYFRNGEKVKEQKRNRYKNDPDHAAKKRKAALERYYRLKMESAEKV